MMTTVELEVETNSVQDGDELLELCWYHKVTGVRGCNTSWRGITVRGRTAWRPDGTQWGNVSGLEYGDNYRYLVRRKVPLLTSQPMYQGTFKVPAGRVVKDWPAKCPRCGKAESAVFLFQSVECRHGCFK